MGAEYVHKTCLSEEELIEAVKEADGAITAIEPYTRRVIETLTRCRVISKMGVGYDNIDVDAATGHGICICNVPDYCMDELSDHAMALILACARKVVHINNAIREAKLAILEPPWVEGPMFKLRGQTLGLVGFGRIPRTLVRKAQGFGMRVIAYDPYISPATVVGYDVEMVEGLDHLLEQSDFVSLHAILTAETKHMFGLEQFKRMKPTAYLINTARGALVDEEALYSALSEGHIAGAALDVMEPELNIRSPLLKLDNLIYSGHSGFYSETAKEELCRRSVEEVARVLKGGWPHIWVNPEVKQRFIARWGKAR